MPPLATVLAFSPIRSPTRGAVTARTTRSIAVPRCRRDRSKKLIPEPTALPSLLPESSRGTWLVPCLHALVAAALAFALSAPLLPPAAHASSSSVGRRLPADAAAFPCEDVQRYYAGLKGLAGDELRTKLAAVVSPHAALRYEDVWDALKILDAADAEHPEASSEVIEIYAQRAVPKLLAGKPDGWNREHLWPRSYGLTSAPSLTDLHNLRPADVNVNSSRGNKYYGECTAISLRCVRPANQEAAPDTETDNEKWAPPFQVRGDVARSLMYMAVSYGSDQKDGTPHLELSDSPSIQRRNMGLLSALLRWNELDPPSRSEQLRNDRVCSLYQHNRNPFVDHPEYANLIWGNPPIKSSDFMGKPRMAWINEFHYENKGKDKNEFVELVIHASLDAKDLMLVLYNGTNGCMYRSLNLADREAITVTEGGSGYLLYTVFTPLQNGPADGISLVYRRDTGKAEVLEFLSYEGSLRAQDGPAKGIVSTDIMLKETDQSSDQDSLGLTGLKVGEFVWRKMAKNGTPGKLNAGQMFYKDHAFVEVDSVIPSFDSFGNRKSRHTTLIGLRDSWEDLQDHQLSWGKAPRSAQKATLHSMATSRREPHPNARTNNRTARNMSPALKPSESDQALLRRARSVPSSPDRRSLASPASASAATASRPSSSFNPRTASSRSTSGSSSSAAHGKSTLLHSVSAMAGAKQAGSIMRRRADSKSGGTSVWPHALTSPNPSPKDPASRAAKSSPSPSSSSVQKSKLSTRSGAEKAAASPKPRTTQKATGAAGKAQAASSSTAHGPGAMAKRRPGMESSAPSIQRTTSVPVAATKAAEQEMELLMQEFDDIESISDPSIEEHLQERLPDPVDFATYAASEQAPSEPCSNHEEHKNDLEVIAEHVFSEEKHEDLNGGDNADAGLDSQVVVAKEAVDEAELNEAVAEADLKGAVDEAMLHEADSESELKQAASEAELKDPEVKEESKASEERSNEVTEEARSKTTTLQERRNKVMALVGRFETAMSGRE
ncbi:hypothetical protein EJB05_21739 [Eragrostis curvula]|uniref:Uncharacterized protein n=1 Tax=Eragrostis curvula TaxID=38414 RepID=A0A5J9V1P3_9POAL|nr:hypothetical protein EJB05_21739 [Eragrostis curvula]